MVPEVAAEVVEEVEIPSLNLRPWNPQDTAELLSWIEEDPAMLEQMGFVTPLALVDSITHVLASSNAVALAASFEDELVGYLAAVNIDPAGSADAHIGVSPRHRGLGDELMQLGLEVCFTQLGLKSIRSWVPRTRRGKVIERWDRRHGFHEPEAKLLYMTQKEWMERTNGRSSS